MSNEISRIEVTIANSGTESTVADVRHKVLVGISTDSAYDTGNITFSVSPTLEGEFLDAYDADADQIVINSVAASRFIPVTHGGIQGFQYIKLTSATTQTGATTLTLILRERVI